MASNVTRNPSYLTRPLKLAYDAGNHTTFTVADDGGLTIATSGTGTLDSTLVLDADGDIEINALGGDIRFKQGSDLLGEFDTSGNLTIPGSFITTTGGMTIRGTGGLLLGTAGNTDPVTMTMITTVGNVAGKPLTLSAGSTVTEGYNLNGGDLILASGGGDGTGTSAMTFSTKVSGTDAVAERMRIHTNGMVGIGVADPDSLLEVLGTTTQQKWSYDANSFLSMTVADSSHTTIATGESGNLILDAGGAINLEPATGSAILLDGTISVDAGVVTGATSITSTAFVGALTGNASGTAATVTGAAQTNITSLGTLTGLAMASTTTTGNALEIDATALTTGSALKLDVADSLTTGATKYLEVINYAKSGVTASGQHSNTTGLVVYLSDTVTNHASSSVTMVGATISVDSANAAGNITQKGLEMAVAADDFGDAANTYGIDMRVMDGGKDIVMKSSADAADYCSISTTASGATTVATVDSDDAEAAHLTFDIQGDTIFKGDIADGTSTAVCKIDASASSLFIESGKKIELGNAGEYIVGDGTDLDIVSSNDATIDTGGVITLDPATITEGNGIQFFMNGTHVGNITGHHTSTNLRLYENIGASTDDYFNIATGASGETTIKTVDAGGTGGNIIFQPDGHVDFESAVGFTHVTEAFSDDSIIGSGATDDTHIDFRVTNKVVLPVTGNITNLNLIFPAVSGNFLLLLSYDGDHTITNYKVYEADESAADGDADVFWPGGTKPNNTASGVDILSFFYDASASSEKCYGVASLAFATP